MTKGGATVDEIVLNKRVVFKGPLQFDYETVELKTELNENDILLRTEYSLISPGTELAIFTGTHVGLPDPNNKFAKFPFYAGYTMVGRVVAVGANVTDYAVGDKVYTAGNHSTYNVIPSDRVKIKLPKDFVTERAPFAKLAEFCMTGIVQTNIKVGDTAVILGLGLMGNIAAQLYSLMGATVIGVDVVEQRLQTARQSGIENVLLSGENVNLNEKVMEMNGGKKPDIVVEATGSPHLVIPALDLVRPLGQVIALGSTRGTVELNVYDYIHRKGVHFSGAYSALAHLDGFPSSLALNKHLIKLIGLNALKIDHLITHRLHNDQAKEGYDMLLNQKDRALGVLLTWED
jgi:2-desacetyl-2-hydroxyethyl bacteriochlorophyllide A dehydrogenase